MARIASGATARRTAQLPAVVPWGARKRNKRSPARFFPRRDPSMTLLKWALIFLAVSIVAGIFGFTDISAASADIARILFYIFVVIFLVLLILGLTVFRV
jgi:uncharacterized membrane protein YtjA (UPF0391 family)